jgi:uncharacterized protein
MERDTLPALIQYMLTPEFYPHPVQMPIQLMQTHASYVLMTGDFAYKLKKPVDFGFLDYSTVNTSAEKKSDSINVVPKNYI